MKVLPRYTNENYNWTISSSNMLLKLIVVTFKYVILFLDTAQYPWTILYLIPALQLSQAHTHVAKAGPVHRSPVHPGFLTVSKHRVFLKTKYVPISARAKDWWYIRPMQLAVQSDSSPRYDAMKNLPSPSPHSSILIPQSLPPPPSHLV